MSENIIIKNFIVVIVVINKLQISKRNSKNLVKARKLSWALEGQIG